MESSYVSENTVSLNADFLKFLSDKRSVEATNHTRQKAAASGKVSLNVENTPGTTPYGISRGPTPTDGRATKTFSITEIEQAEKTMNVDRVLTKVPTEVQ